MDVGLKVTWNLCDVHLCVLAHYWHVTMLVMMTVTSLLMRWSLLSVSLVTASPGWRLGPGAGWCQALEAGLVAWPAPGPGSPALAPGGWHQALASLSLSALHSWPATSHCLAATPIVTPEGDIARCAEGGQWRHRQGWYNQLTMTSPSILQTINVHGLISPRRWSTLTVTMIPHSISAGLMVIQPIV